MTTEAPAAPLTAELVRDVTTPASNAIDQRLYRLSRPVRLRKLFDDDEGEGAEFDHLFVSAVRVLGAPETYVFPAAADGAVIDWLELDGSFKGGLDVQRALDGFLLSHNAPEVPHV